MVLVHAKKWKKAGPAQPRVMEIGQDCGRINHIKSKYFQVFTISVQRINESLKSNFNFKYSFWVWFWTLFEAK